MLIIYVIRLIWVILACFGVFLLGFITGTLTLVLNWVTRRCKPSHGRENNRDTRGSNLKER